MGQRRAYCHRVLHWLFQGLSRPEIHHGIWRNLQSDPHRQFEAGTPEKLEMRALLETNAQKNKPVKRSLAYKTTNLL